MSGFLPTEIIEKHAEAKESGWADVWVGDEVVVSWEGSSDQIPRFHGRVLEIDLASGMMYLGGSQRKNSNNYIRAPFAGYKIEAHLKRTSDGKGYIQGGDRR